MSAISVKPKFPRRREGMYRPEPELLRAIRSLYPNAPAEYDSVTTVLRGGVPKPELIYWLIGEAARRPIEDPWTFDSVEKVRRDMDDSLEASSERGKTVHSWIEAYAKGASLNVNAVPERFRGYAVAFEKWARTVSWDHIVFTEANVYETANRYAGTADLALRDPLGIVTLYDFKTNAKAQVYRETGLQLCAYKNADFIVEGLLVRDVPSIDCTEAIGLSPDGNWKPFPFKESMEDFLAALRIYRFKKRGER